MGRHRAFVAQVPMKNGAPDLELPAGSSYWKELDGLWHAQFRGHHLLAYRVGVNIMAGDVVVIGVGSRRVLEGLQHLGARVSLLKDAWQKPAQRQWLLDHGIEEVDGMPKVPVCYAGDNPFLLAADLGGDE